jgi:hypothetical protein
VAVGIGPDQRPRDEGPQGRTRTSVPRLVLVGTVLIGVALTESVVAAFAPPMLAMDHAALHDSHLLAFIGMVVVLVGLLRGARPRSDRGTGSREQSEDSDAVR